MAAEETIWAEPVSYCQSRVMGSSISDSLLPVLLLLQWNEGQSSLHVSTVESWTRYALFENSVLLPEGVVQ